MEKKQQKKAYILCRNETRSAVIADKITKADSYFSRLVGLLPRKSLNDGEGLWIIPCSDIHSVGMQFEFDAIFLDRDFKVVYLVERMKPWRMTRLIRNSRSVLEVKAGIIASTGTSIGDQLLFTI